jgi:type I restriction enzyme M protein
MAKKQKTNDTLNLESILFNCREYLRSNASLNDKRDLLLTLVFLRFIGEKFENTQSEMRQKCLTEEITDEKVISSFLNSPTRYKGIAFVPEKARWSMIIDQPASKLNATLDDAIQELEDSGDALKGCVRLGLFTSINLEANVIKKVVDEVNKISHKTFGEEKDLIGRV